HVLIDDCHHDEEPLAVLVVRDASVVIWRPTWGATCTAKGSVGADAESIGDGNVGRQARRQFEVASAVDSAKKLGIVVEEIVDQEWIRKGPARRPWLGAEEVSRLVVNADDISGRHKNGVRPGGNAWVYGSYALIRRKTHSRRRR